MRKMRKMKWFLAVMVLLSLLIVLGGCSSDGEKAQNITSYEQATSGSSVTYKLSLDDIKKKYTDARVLNILNVGQEYVLIESQQDTFANRFDLYNLKTGNMDTLPTMPEFVTLEKAENENYFIFSSSGRNSESPFKQFPYLMKCFRIKNDTGVGDNFIVVREDKYFSLDESVQAGSKEGSLMSDVNITFSGLEVLFKPVKGQEGGFYADATDIPPTKTSYDKGRMQLTFAIGTQYLGERLKERKKVSTKDNQFISSCEIIQRDNKIFLVVGILDSVKRYLVKIKRLPNGNMSDGFPYFSVEFKGEE